LEILEPRVERSDERVVIERTEVDIEEGEITRVLTERNHLGDVAEAEDALTVAESAAAQLPLCRKLIAEDNPPLVECRR